MKMKIKMKKLLPILLLLFVSCDSKFEFDFSSNTSTPIVGNWGLFVNDENLNRMFAVIMSFDKDGNYHRYMNLEDRVNNNHYEKSKYTIVDNMIIFHSYFKDLNNDYEYVDFNKYKIENDTLFIFPINEDFKNFANKPTKELIEKGENLDFFVDSTTDSTIFKFTRLK